MQLAKTIILVLWVLPVLGCSTFLNKASLADHIARKANFTKEYINTGDFTLLSYQRLNKGSDSIRIYIEGDGKAWESRHELSGDPTPSNPLALRLAILDPAENVAYIGRPGQYPIDDIEECDSKYWSKLRFAPEVIDAFNKAIDQLKEAAKASQVELVGYSGGGAIAVLVAARRNDVASIRTIGGNLDPKAFCQYHKVDPLEGSLDPMVIAQEISHIPQRHFIGSRDTVVPDAIAWSFVKEEGDRGYDRITIVKGATHTKPWPQRWKYLLTLAPS